MEAQAEARVALPQPRRYMAQLCKHFQHRLPVTLDDDRGRIEFPDGVCTLSALDDALLMRVAAADPARLPGLQDVVARHLLRFAFRDPPPIVWLPATRPAK